MKSIYSLLLIPLLLIALTINAQELPEIDLQPIDQTVCLGDSAGFVIEAVGDGDLHYQWQKDDIDLQDETDSICIIQSVAANDAGIYRCIVSNDNGSDTTDIALLIIDYVLPTQILGPQEVESNDTALYSVENTIGHSYEFFTEQGLILETTDSSASVEWGSNEVGFIKMVETNANGCYGDTVTQMVIIGDVAPFIVQHPISQDICNGTSVNFEVLAEGTSELIYQWQLNEVDLVGETNNSLDIESATINDNGNYRCIVSNESGSDTSDIAVLSVDYVSPTQISGAFETESYDTILYTVDNTPGHIYEFFVMAGNILETSDTSVRVEWGVDTVGFVKVLESNANGCYGDTISQLIVIGDVLPFFVMQPVSQTVCFEDNVTFEVIAAGTSELYYQWQLDGKSLENDTTKILIIPSVVFENEGAYRCIISNSLGSDTSEVAVLDIDQVELSEIMGANSVNANDTIEYSVSLVEGHNYEFFVSDGVLLGSSDTSVTVLWDVPGISYVHMIEENINGCVGDTVTLQVLVYGDGTMVDFILSPISQSVCLNDSLSFTVQVSGFPEFIYQWQKDEENIEDANDSIYIIPYAQLEDAANYRCIVSNAFGSDTSEIANLVVDELISDIIGPQYVDEFEITLYSVALIEGHNYQFEVDGGNIIETTQNTVTVHWGSVGSGLVKMLESVEGGCEGDWVELDIYVGTVGIEPEKEIKENIYPNPVNDFVNIKMDGKNTFRLYNILGSQVYETEFENEIKLNLSHLDQGMYIYKVNGRSGRIIKK